MLLWQKKIIPLLDQGGMGVVYKARQKRLVTPVEYGLGLVGLFEDSNRLIYRITVLKNLSGGTKK
jgi:hypothetical protein